MGVDYDSYVVIGCEVDSSKLYSVQKVRNCNCEIDDADTANFCSNCGRAVWGEENLPIEGFDEDNYKFMDYQVVTVTDNERFWIAIRSARASDYTDEAVKLETPDDISGLREELKSKLGPLGLWDEKKFGIWVIQYVSY